MILLSFALMPTMLLMGMKLLPVFQPFNVTATPVVVAVDVPLRSSLRNHASTPHALALTLLMSAVSVEPHTLSHVAGMFLACQMVSNPPLTASSNCHKPKKVPGFPVIAMSLH
jgi:hypothetical protein